MTEHGKWNQLHAQPLEEILSNRIKMYVIRIDG